MKKNKNIIVVLFLLLFNLFAYSQNQNINYEDSIKKYFYNDPLKAKLFTHGQLKFGNIEKNKDKSKKVIAYCYLADFSNILNQKDSALYYFDKAYTEAKKINNSNLEIIVTMNKADYYFNQNDYDAAIITYNSSIDLAKEINDYYGLAYLTLKKGDILFELEKYDEALLIYKESLESGYLKDINNQLNIKLGLARTYIKQKKPEKALVFIKPSIKEAKEKKLKEHEILFLTLLSDYYIDKKKFSEATSALNESLVLANITHNLNTINYVTIKLSKLLTLQNKHIEAISLLNTIIDSKESKISKEALSEIYYVLAENYKSNNEIEKSNEYFSLFIANYKQLGQKKIDTIDHLNKIEISEIEKREADQLNQKKILFYIIGALLLIVVIILIIKKKEKKDEQLKFEILLNKINKFENEKLLQTKQINDEIDILSLDSIEETKYLNPDVEDDLFSIQLEESEIVSIPYEEIDSIESEDEENLEIISQLNIKDETITEILEKLIRLEEKNAFLQQDFTLHKVAKRLRTNTAYLSKIVNTELNKSFSTYVNELRINYIIVELKNNSKLRSYSIKAIGEEIGYKSPESFTKYFKIATGISPSVYIKKINKM